MAEVFKVNQIVRGKVCGVFVILGFRNGGAQLKEVNPANLTETAPGELFLPLDCIRLYYE